MVTGYEILQVGPRSFMVGHGSFMVGHEGFLHKLGELKVRA